MLMRAFESGSQASKRSLDLHVVLPDNTDDVVVANEIAEVMVAFSLYITALFQAIRCVLVIPARNADLERCFSAANRLSR